jgi:hypothetical protein
VPSGACAGASRFDGGNGGGGGAGPAERCSAGAVGSIAVKVEVTDQPAEALALAQVGTAKVTDQACRVALALAQVGSTAVTAEVTDQGRPSGACAGTSRFDGGNGGGDGPGLPSAERRGRAVTLGRRLAHTSAGNAACRRPIALWEDEHFLWSIVVDTFAELHRARSAGRARCPQC